ncbi:hypothetical protein LAJPDJIK_04037 [Aeromonas salmonicida]|uniref:Uncharacterized protein n=1 Tax=Aeromonas salmonicida subsp. salmonicida 01-B526 TaxID=1076135 RepID=A0ABN0DWH7_AERSS|nr:hypothetical protein IYQ_18561 [Aeromonas salmonicida subsp. salmonicida 01-B526]
MNGTILLYFNMPLQDADNFTQVRYIVSLFNSYTFIIVEYRLSLYSSLNNG